MLLNSIQQELRDSVERSTKCTLGFIPHFLTLWSKDQSTSVTRNEQVKEEIRALDIRKYSGQNVVSLSEDLLIIVLSFLIVVVVFYALFGIVFSGM